MSDNVTAVVTVAIIAVAALLGVWMPDILDAITAWVDAICGRRK